MFAALVPLASYLSSSVPVLFGGSVFGLTASVGELVTDHMGPEPDDCTEVVTPRPRSLRVGDRRTRPRSHSTPVRVALAGPQRAQPAEGWVVDRSGSGLGLHLEEPPRLGEVLEVCPCEVPGLRVWVPAVVKNCRPGAGWWKVGCEFLQPPPFGVLRLFG